MPNLQTWIDVGFWYYGYCCLSYSLKAIIPPLICFQMKKMGHSIEDTWTWLLCLLDELVSGMWVVEHIHRSVSNTSAFNSMGAIKLPARRMAHSQEWFVRCFYASFLPVSSIVLHSIQSRSFSFFFLHHNKHGNIGRISYQRQKEDSIIIISKRHTHPACICQSVHSTNKEAIRATW